MTEHQTPQTRKTSITLKIVLLTVSVGLLSTFLANWYVYGVAREEIRKASIDELTAVRETRARQVEDYFQQIRHHVLTLAESQRVIDAMRSFHTAYDDLASGFKPDPTGMVLVDAALSDHQRHRLADTGQTADADPRRFAPLLPASPAGRLLQYRYALKRHDLAPVAAGDAATEQTLLKAYDGVHRRFDPFWEKMTERFDFYDAFLVDQQTGIVVYARAKEAEFATNLETGPYRDTNLASVYRAARDSNQADFVRMSDFQIYPPSGYAPAAFIATPIFEGGEKTGVLILQISVDKINAVMTADRKWEKEGMGRTGEGFLIGGDLRMRSDSRFLVEFPDDYFALMVRRGVDAGTLHLMRRHNTSILLQAVETEAAKDLFRGKTGVRHAEDYRGETVFAAYRPVHIQDVDWGIIVKMDEAEMMARVYDIRRRILVMIPFLLAVVVGLAVLMSRQILRPVGLLLKGIRGLEERNLSVRVPVISADEFGELATSFNTMAQNMLEADENRLLILDSAMEGIFGLNTKGATTFVNAAALRLLGYTESELLDQPMHAMVHHTYPDGSAFPREDCPMYRSVTQGETHTIDNEVLWRKDGTSIPVEYNSTPIRKGGEILGAVVSFRDITKSRAAEDAIRRSEDRVRRILDTANEGFWFLDNDGVTTQVNPAMCKILGRDGAEIVGRRVTEFYDEKGLAVLHDQLALRDQGVESAYENDLVRPDGARVPCLFNATPFFDEDGIKVGAFAMVTDITEQRRAEAAMKESEERLKLALKGGNIGFWDVDFKNGKSIFDEKWAQMLGYELDEIEQTRQTWLDSIHPEDQEQVLGMGEEYRKGDRPDYEVEYRGVTKKGDVKWFASRGTAVAWDDAGAASRMVGTVRDITNRKRSEMTQARRLRSEKAMAAVSRALLGSDTESETLRGALKQLLTAAQVDRVYVFRNREDPDRGLCMEHWLEASAPGIDPILSGERPTLWPYAKGFSRWLEEMAEGRPIMGTVEDLPESEKERLKQRDVVSLLNFPVFTGGRWFGFIGFEDAFLERFWTSSDVTLLGTTAEIIGAFVERQQVQEAMRDSEARIKTILHAISMGIIVIDPENRTIADINPVAADMIGLPPEEIIGKVCHQFICPREDRNCPILDLDEEIDNAERVLLTAEGRELPILKTVVPIQLGGKKHLLESFVDISERKVAEEKLHSHLAELERFNQLTINREEKMIQLKEEINRLLGQLGRPEKYKIVT